jgi:hypothetical protein
VLVVVSSSDSIAQCKSLRSRAASSLPRRNRLQPQQRNNGIPLNNNKVARVCYREVIERKLMVFDFRFFPFTITYRPVRSCQPVLVFGPNALNTFFGVLERRKVPRNVEKLEPKR